MKRLGIWIVGVVILLSVVGLGGCIGEEQDSILLPHGTYGRWIQISDSETTGNIIIFYSDGSYDVKIWSETVGVGTWSTKENRLFLDDSLGYKEIWTYSVSGTTLALTTDRILPDCEHLSYEYKASA